MAKKKPIHSNIRYRKSKRNNHRDVLYKEWMEMVRKNNKKKAILYLVEIRTEEEVFLKIGITTTSITRRFRDSNLRFKKIKSVTTDCDTAFKLESKVLRTFRKSRYYPTVKFSGFTECFKISTKKDIINYIKRIK
jgi:hypothetical protein